MDIHVNNFVLISGRIDFYDQTGVIRDVLQNHLTELLSLVAMDLPSNISDSVQIESKKLQLLKHILPVSKSSVLTGQYAKYLEEAKAEITNTNMSHMTPTFAAALLTIHSPRWQGVPFVLMSGKHMKERSSYIRILFREHEFCVSGCEGGNSTFTRYPRQLVFQLGHGPVPSAGILVSKSLLTPAWPPGLTQLPLTSKDSNIHGQSPGDFYYGVPEKDNPAYVTVFHDLFNNIRETFVTSERVLALWKIWKNMVTASPDVPPRMYREFDAGNLNFTVKQGNIDYIEKLRIIHFGETQPSLSSSIPTVYRNATMHSHSLQDLVSKLAKTITEVAVESVKERNEFHLAFSGGRTPIPLFKELASNFHHFPWDLTHIWQVDERCVPHYNPASNFHTLHENLLKYVSIPYDNIHPMPVDILGKLCDTKDKGVQSYDSLLNHLVPDLTLDFIVLGLGSDGHTASLFPLSAGLTNLHDNVAYTQSSLDGTMDRMSLMLSVINSARNIAVLVTGIEKHAILHQLTESDGNNKHFPITFVKPTNGNLTWFIDYDSWLGFESDHIKVSM